MSQVKTHRRKDGTVVKAHSKTRKKGWVIYPKDRRTPLLVDGNLPKKAAIKRALANKKRGSDEVDKVRRLTDSEQMQADKGKWVSGHSVDKERKQLRGQGPKPKSHSFSNRAANLGLIEFSSDKKVATKTNPALWEQAKQEAKSKMGSKHSARLMQQATRIYKAKGGGYSGGSKEKAKTGLSKWSKQRWQASDGGNSRRTTKTGKTIVKKYLPEKAWKNLDKKEVTALNRSKSKAEKQGKQFSKSPKKLTGKISKYWKE